MNFGFFWYFWYFGILIPTLIPHNTHRDNKCTQDTLKSEGNIHMKTHTRTAGNVVRIEGNDCNDAQCFQAREYIGGELSKHQLGLHVTINKQHAWEDKNLDP